MEDLLQGARSTNNIQEQNSMATISDAGTATFIPAAAQPTIAFIQAQITASVPSQYASAITAQFAGGSSQAAPMGSASTSGSVELPASDYAAAATGAGLAQPTINFIDQQISAMVPSQYASAIEAQFAGASSSASGSASVVQAPVATDLQNFFAAHPASSI